MVTSATGAVNGDILLNKSILSEELCDNFMMNFFICIISVCFYKVLHTRSKSEFSVLTFLIHPEMSENAIFKVTMLM